MRAGDQPYGAVVLRGDVVVSAAPSRVVTSVDPTAHAEMEAIRDAARRLRPGDGAPLHYECHRPAQTTLYRPVQQHAETFFAEAEATA
ncbi:MAG: hypothetical protein IPF50_12095 [Proteobacteria bacterium]|nr:hypothetical protein [Pseudomonadota bacterium]